MSHKLPTSHKDQIKGFTILLLIRRKDLLAFTAAQTLLLFPKDERHTPIKPFCLTDHASP